MQNSSYRIDLADALRGFAVLGILIVHSVEHYNNPAYPEVTNTWLNFFDEIVLSATFFLFGGKAYAIFALLFGFSFFIQDNNQRSRGNDFRLRFLWRLVLLFGWGVLNAIFYTGDILVFFSFVAVSLVLVSRLPDKVVFWIAFIFLLQPLEWIKVVTGIINPSDEPVVHLYTHYYLETIPVLENGNFWETVKMSLTSGQLYSFLWQVESGRLFQTSSLFMFGMLIGRRNLFINTPLNIKFWIRIAFTAIILFLPLNGLNQIVPEYVTNETVLSSLKIITKSLTSLSFMFFMVGLFILIFYLTDFQKVLMKLTIYGRMSLTMYITQSILGGFIFLNWGLGLGTILSISQSLLIALVIFIVQYSFAYFWFKYHKQGPIEWVWKKATWIGGKQI